MKWVGLKGFDEYFFNAFRDPLRRRNTISRIIEGRFGALAAIGAYLLLNRWLPWYGALPFASLAGPLAEYLLYEFLLERLGLAGPYWERGERDGEQFKIG